MNASWSMVFGALLAGLVGGFMIPVRPEIRDVPTITAAKKPEPAKSAAADKPATPVAAKAQDATEVRRIPITEAAVEEPKPAASMNNNNRADANSCAKEAWPYRSPNCLDRTATVAPAATVETRRVEPTSGLTDKGAATAAAAKPEPTKAEPVKPEATKPEPKVVAAPPAREQRTEPAPPAEQAAVRSNEEPRAEAADERPAAKSAKQTRRATRRSNRNTVDFNDGIPTRVYLRGPDGRLYLAPEYQPSGRPIYFVR